jgi:hypothetical protein
MLSRGLLLSLLLGPLAGTNSGQERVWTLWSSAGAHLTIVSPKGDIAAERLQLRLAERGVRQVARKTSDDGAGNVIFVGTPQTNPALQDYLKKAGMLSIYHGLQEEEYRIWSQTEGPRVIVVAAGGGAAGSLYAVGDLVNYHLQFTADKLQVPASLDVHEAPEMKLRYFWNWDNRTRWNLSSNAVYAEAMASMANFAYSGTADTFRLDMFPMIDFMSEHKINALVLWGFARDEHGGVEASKELVEYANRRGVKILPGVGIDQYGGFYYHGENKFNIDSWTAQHPELRAMDKEGHYVEHTLCMDKEANRQWFREGIRWLFQTFAIAGVNLESGEFRVCYCPDSIRARDSVLAQEHSKILDNFRRLALQEDAALIAGGREFSVDMGRNVTLAAEEIHRVRPDALITYAAYTGFDESMREDPPYFLKAIPPYAIAQWTLTGMVNRKQWPEGLKSPVPNAIGLFHVGNTAVKETRTILYPKLAQVTAKAYAAGMQGMSIYGELPADNPITEFNYLVFSEFTFHPNMSEEEFLKTRLAPYYGGDGAARRLLQIASLIGSKKDGEVPEKLDDAIRLAKEARDAAQGGARNRWERWITALQGLDQKK